MKVPVSWLRELVELPDTTTAELADRLTRAGLLVESIEKSGPDVRGPLVIGRILSADPEPQKNGKTIRWCRVDVGEHNPPGEPGRGIVCGAPNAEAGKLVVVALDGAVLPGDFRIAARKTYGHISDGMICAEDELGIGTDHSGIMIIPDGTANPGDDAVEVLGGRDEVLEIDITPDLGYCLSLRGVAREAAIAYGVPFRDPLALPVPAPRADGYPVRLETPKCPLFVALTVRGIDPDRPTPKAMAHRLQAAGMRSISLAVDITNYVMLETGQPLHAYAADRLRGPIVAREAQGEETLTTLDGSTRRIAAGDLVIADDSGPIGVAGVMGGASTELHPDTTDLVLEAAWFDPVTVARASRRLKLTSEASRRFERGVDAGATYAVARRAAELFVSLGGGRLEAGETVAGAVPEPPSLTIDAGLPGRVLGTAVAPDRVTEILAASGVGVTALGDSLTVRPPTWRPDLRDPYDYVEEVGRKLGLDTVPPRLPTPTAGRGLTRAQQLRRAAGAALAAGGAVEVITLPFVAAADLDALRVPADDPRRALVRIANPLSEERPYLRTGLLPGLAEAARVNLSRSAESVALFEIGRVFRHSATSAVSAAPLPGVDARPSDDELAGIEAAIPDQPKHAAALLVNAGGWQRALALALAAGRVFGVELERVADDHAPWHPGRCAALRVGEQTVGHAGELHPQACDALALPRGTAGLELDVDALVGLAPLRAQIPALSAHPVVKEDVALIVDRQVPVAAVAEALRDGGGALLEDVTLFDVYEGEQAGAGKKSLAFALRLRALDRTLKQAEAAEARDAAVRAAAERCGAVQRVG